VAGHSTKVSWGDSFGSTHLDDTLLSVLTGALPPDIFNNIVSISDYFLLRSPGMHKMRFVPSVAKRICAVIALLAALVISSTAGLPAKSPPKQVRRVLVFYEVSSSYPAVAVIDREIRSALDQSNFQIEFYSETLETVMLQDEASQQNIRTAYVRKYRDHQPDLLIAEGGPSITFVESVRDEFFPGVPVVFCGAEPEMAGHPKLGPDFTGVWMDLQPTKTLEIAMKLQPGTRHVFVVGGTSPYDKLLEHEVSGDLQPYQKMLEVKPLLNLSLPELLEQISRLPANSIILFTDFSQDRGGTKFVGATQVLPVAAEVANAPIFVLAETQIGKGAIGGYVNSFAEQGRIAGRTAVRVLEGTPVRDIPIVSNTNVFMFDVRVLDRWHIKEGDLPPGSILLNRKPSVWESYKWYIVTVGALLLLQTLLITQLLLQRTKRRRAENQLAITYERLRLSVEAGRSVGWEWDPKTRQNHWFGDLQSMFGIASDTYHGHSGDLQRRVLPEDWPSVSRAIEKSQQSHEPYSAEFRVRRNDGAVRWIAAKGRFFYSNNGDPELMLGMAVDITERKNAEEALSSIGRRLIEAHEEERARIARELHDDINQQLALVAVELGVWDSDGRVQATKHRIDGIANDVQALSHRLHSSKLEYLGLITAVKSFCRELSERNRAHIDFNHEALPQGLSKEVSLCLFRIMQEALQNAVKHSGADRFEVDLRVRSGEIILKIRDHGKGFDVDKAMSSRGLGLISMRERVNLVKGTIIISSKPAAGTEIEVHVPLAVDQAIEVGFEAA